MGKAGQQRRLRQEKQRERQRAARDAKAPGSAPGAGSARGPEAEVSAAELAAYAIAEAMRTLCAGDQAIYGTYLDSLAVEHRLGWTALISQQLAEYLRAAVSGAWQGGWQPAELVRQVGRELSPAHVDMISDIITDEMRRYPAARVDGRWAAQLAAIEAGRPLPGVWWGSDAEYLAAVYELGRDAEYIMTVGTAIETLHAFHHLPALEKLLPLPGQATAARPEPAPSGEPADERMLARIRALLAKAEATEFAEEAEALSGRAQELMAKYSIDHALLAAESGSKEEPGGRRMGVDNPYEAPKVTLLQTVAQANRCRTVWLRDVGLVTVIGFPADLDAVELLFTSLLVQANTAMVRAGGKRDAYGRSRTRAFRQSFLLSYAMRIGERLAEAADQAEQEVVAEQRAAAGAEPGGGNRGAGGKGMDLVPFLAARQEAVDDAVDALFGDTLTRTRSVRATDAEGWTSGRAAADVASLRHNPEVADAAR